LLVYTFVFGTILQARWGGAEESKLEFALTLFAGLAVFQIFSELMNSSCNAISQNVNFVKKVVFPLEIIPVVHLLAILLRAAISIAILMLAVALLLQRFPPTVVFFPLILLPMLMLSLGLAWFLASLGVYVRDVGQFMGVIVNVLFFLTPIFYPVSRLPEGLRWIAHINPLAFIVEGSRRTLIWNQPPQWGAWIVVTLVSAVVMQLGYAWFMETKRGFADVL
jgi:lipopolysaccharide transport system permease protein